MNDNAVVLSTVRGRSHEVLMLAKVMVNAETLEAFDRAYQRLCNLLEPIGERLDMVPMEDLGYVELAPDQFYRTSL